ncbi:glycosyltransferase family 2 protein [Thalassomonas sp. M1454]|uniref:glycosyltransferase family 2 protein n=1 Tax=Thalassomonas sp. M1454 TaxID=2594477 RepID=UPI00117CF886|nr:glycosyltransferase family 2 protein [Thalassomonas sp. M1454]TRX57399.1 glycosyltransferase family 2 protein [Thalassomonas sp. M1454]
MNSKALEIAIVCVNHNSYCELNLFIDSIQKALLNSDNVNLVLVIVDNSSNKKEITVGVSYDLTVIDSVNDGYMAGLNRGYQSLADTSIYDYIIASNVDLEMKSTFFQEIKKSAYPEDVLVIGPSIYSRKYHIDMNPQRIYRPKKNKYLINEFIFSFPQIYRLQRFISKYKKNKSNATKYPYATEMYACHGAVFIFTSEFFNRMGTIDYPLFLYGEEIFIAEQVRSLGGRIIYDPNLEFLDEGSVSTSKLDYKRLAKEHLKATRFILKNYYP